MDRSGSKLTILERLPITDTDHIIAQDIDNLQSYQKNGVYQWGQLPGGHTKVTIIDPCDQEHLKKYSNTSFEKKTILETYEMYKEVTEPWIESQSRTEWVENIINGVSESEKILFSDEDCVLLPDYKWRSMNVDELYLLCIFKNEKLRSLRDIQDVELLKKIKSNIYRTIKERYGLDSAQVSLYFHYPPTYYRLHLHIVHNKTIEFVSAHVNLAHSLDTVIYNLTLQEDYYRRADLPVLIGPGHPLF